MPDQKSYGTKNNKEVLTYHHNPLFGLAELGFVATDGTPGTGDRVQATLIDCTSLNGVTARSKQLHIQATDTTNPDPQNIVFNLWFAETMPELEALVAIAPPAQFLAMTVLDTKIDLRTAYLAIDYDSSLSGTVDPGTLFVSLTIT